MREIKFRAWNKDSNKMFSAEEMGEDELTINPDGRGFVNVNSISPKLSQYYAHMIPLQFTGIYDKDDKEIYEGDIIKTPTGSGVVFNRLGCWFVEHQQELGYFVKDNIAVIGNKYHNPNVLN